MRFLSVIVGIIFALGVAVLAASNVGLVTVSLWPFPFMAELPFYAFILFLALVSFVCGAFFLWLSEFSVRVDRYFKTKKLAKIEKQLKEKS